VPSRLISRAKDGFSALRRRRPALDHVIRAWQRYQADDGDRLAAAVTYYGFLAFFPLIALAFSVLGFVVAHDPSVRDSIARELSQTLPGIIGNGPNQINIDKIASAKAGAGVIGFLGLLYAGLGWVDALRTALRTIWHQSVKAGNMVVTKLTDAMILVVLGLALLASVLISTAATTATGTILGWLGLDGSLTASIVVRVLAIVLAIAADVAVFSWLFTRLPRARPPGARLLQGALLMSVLFEVLKAFGSIYLKNTTGNPVYGTFAAVVGLLIWINLVSRLLLFCAAWTVTAPYEDDLPPSGSAERSSPGTPDGSERGQAELGPRAKPVPTAATRP
jgi:membrane protein